MHVPNPRRPSKTVRSRGTDRGRPRPGDEGRQGRDRHRHAVGRQRRVRAGGGREARSPDRHAQQDLLLGQDEGGARPAGSRVPMLRSRYISHVPAEDGGGGICARHWRVHFPTVFILVAPDRVSSRVFDVCLFPLVFFSRFFTKSDFSSLRASASSVSLRQKKQQTSKRETTEHKQWC